MFPCLYMVIPHHNADICGRDVYMFSWCITPLYSPQSHDCVAITSAFATSPLFPLSSCSAVTLLCLHLCVFDCFFHNHCASVPPSLIVSFTITVPSSVEKSMSDATIVSAIRRLHSMDLQFMCSTSNRICHTGIFASWPLLFAARLWSRSRLLGKGQPLSARVADYWKPLRGAASPVSIVSHCHQIYTFPLSLYYRFWGWPTCPCPPYHDHQVHVHHVMTTMSMSIATMSMTTTSYPWMGEVARRRDDFWRKLKVL